MFDKSNKSTIQIFIVSVLSCFLVTVIIKINFFLNYFINIDSAFYVKWFSDLSLTNKIFPDSENSFYKNLLSSKETLLHHYLEDILIIQAKFTPLFLQQLIIY